MKINPIIAAGLMIAGIGMSSAASAQMNNGSYPPHGDQQMDHRAGDMEGDRDHHGDMRDHRDDRGTYNRDDRHGWAHGRQHCHIEWHHHRRMRICR